MIEQQLKDHIHEVYQRPYKLGRNDCCLLVLKWADHLAGTTHHEDIVGTYSTMFAGLREYAPSGMMAAIEDGLVEDGWESFEGNGGEKIQVGDIIITDIGSPGIWTGKAIAMMMEGLRGIAYGHITHAKVFLRCPKQ